MILTRVLYPLKTFCFNFKMRQKSLKTYMQIGCLYPTKDGLRLTFSYAQMMTF